MLSHTKLSYDDNNKPKSQINHFLWCYAEAIHQAWVPLSTAGGRLNKKDGLTRYGDSHVKDKTS